MSARLRYCWPSDNHAAGITPTANTGTILSSFPAANATDGDPAVPCIFSGGTAGSLLFDLGSAKQVDVVAVVGHNLDATLTIQANSSSSWTTPPLSVTIPTVTRDADGHWPNRWVDLSVSLPSAGDRTYRYWRLVYATNTDVNPRFGEVWLTTIRQLAQNHDWGYRIADVAPDIVHETDAGVRYVYGHGVRVRRFDATFDGSDAVAEAIRAWWLAARGRGRSFLVIPDGDEGELLQVRFATSDLPTTYVMGDRRSLPVQFEELSRGVAL